MLKELILRLASKKLLVVILAYSLIVLDGTSTLTLDPAVVIAASTALTTGILAQGAVDWRGQAPPRDPDA